ncbi:hypothetical protein [Stenotrophobium rhamnosiphilum]|uniref:Uncharacterized protein n=1 Tax=Stenotrophobium rhamnosiphilum TaxID=2029166 RepID=A0A2T5MGL9_9GAMM|nr:hypothetical protein [Stenotrophobium rhamnosiphilum]PTU31703.1 hypothetical protein CJD38_10365 [Stenotrophobium rhamnosiphilum]
MLNFRLLIASVVMAIASPAVADIPLKDYKLIKSDPASAQIISNYFTGFARGLQWSNGYLQSQGGKLMFCMPPTIKLDADIIHGILDREIAARQYAETMPVEAIVLKGFVNQYPCTSANSGNVNAAPEKVTRPAKKSLCNMDDFNARVKAVQDRSTTEEAANQKAYQAHVDYLAGSKRWTAKQKADYEAQMLSRFDLKWESDAKVKGLNGLMESAIRLESATAEQCGTIISETIAKLESLQAINNEAWKRAIAKVDSDQP